MDSQVTRRMEYRNRILPDKKQPTPLHPENRPLIISERTGDKIGTSSLKTVLSRIENTAEAKEQGIAFVRFTFHDLKRMAIN